MIDVTYKIGGREVGPNDFSDDLEKAILAEITKKVKDILGSVVCPEHHQKPKVMIVGQSVNDLSWVISGCCQKLIDTSTNKIK